MRLLFFFCISKISSIAYSKPLDTSMYISKEKGYSLNITTVQLPNSGDLTSIQSSVVHNPISLIVLLTTHFLARADAVSDSMMCTRSSLKMLDESQGPLESTGAPLIHLQVWLWLSWADQSECAFLGKNGMELLDGLLPEAFGTVGVSESTRVGEVSPPIFSAGAATALSL